MSRFAVDTGPLVALFDRRDPQHAWAKETFAAIAPPLFTCEAVVSEACFLAREIHGGVDDVMALLDRGVVTVEFDLGAEAHAVRRLMAKYADVPMSLADGCLVRMAELETRLTVVTLDDDFVVYRRHGRQAIPVLMP